jgi:formylglycine-generating enzyme required for sulfatase activity
MVAELIMDAEPALFDSLLPMLARNRETLTTSLRAKLADPVVESGGGEPARQTARIGIALMRLGDDGPVWPLFRHVTEPDVRSHLIHLLQPYGVSPIPLADRLVSEWDPSARRALLLALGEYEPSALDAERATRVQARMVQWYLADPDPGIHAAVEWLSQQWQLDLPAEAPSAPAAARQASDPGWYRTRTNQHTLVVLPPTGPFRAGSPAGAERAGDWEDPLNRLIPRTFALGAREVTVGQFSQFQSHHPHPAETEGLASRRPATQITWVDAARYCNWLSEQEGIPQAEWCFRISAEPGNDAVVVIPSDYLQRTGYRLPTETEWEYACRAGATTGRYFGDSPTLLDRYEWFQGSRYPGAQPEVMPVGQRKPNDFGLFDMLGNVAEWCIERPDINLRENRQDELEPLPDLEENLYFGDRDHRVEPTEKRAVRAGKFSDLPVCLRSAHRTQAHPYNSYHNVGFRIARTMPAYGVGR